MSMDIGVLLEMEGFDGSTGISPAQTLFSGHSANPSTSLSVSLVRSYIDEGPGPSSSTPNVKGRISTSRTPVSRSHLLSMTNINDHDEQTLGILIESDRKIEHGAHSSSRQWTQLSGSPNRTAEAFVSSPLCSSPTSVFQMSPFTLPRSYSSGLGVSPLGTLVSTKHAMGGHASKHSVDNRSPSRESGEDLQWQMYLTTSLSNSFDFCDSPTRVDPPLTSNYPSYSGDSYSVSHEVTSEDSTSLSTSDLDPFSALSNGMAIKPNSLHPDPYELGIGIMPARPEGFSPSRNLGGFLIQESTEHVDSTVNDLTLPMSNETYSTLMELTPPTFEFESAGFSSIEAPSVARDVSPPLRDMSPSPRRGRSPTLSRRGLSGWESTDGPDHLQASFSNKSLIPEARKRKSSPLSSSVDSSRDCKPTPLNSTSGFGLPRKNFLALNAIPATNAHGHGLKSQVKEQHVKDRRVRQDFDPDSDELDKSPHRYDDSESDDYRPSRSPSPDSFSAPSSHALVVAACKSSKESRGGLEEVNRLIPRKKAKRGKGKAKGSAALALAVVTQLKTKSRSRSLGLNDDEDEDEYDAMTLYQQGKTGIRKRKNHPIPLPVPIPNLNKKSRGRKVPFVADPELLNRSQGVTSSPNSSAFGVNIKGETVEVNMADGSGVEDLLASRSSRRVRRKVTTVAPTSMTNADELSGARSYVCVVPGCGKCFVRGEHLKRHVRSIHTHDKPHPCPYEGCDKSFSRRDNLGQHVRIHLQP